MKADEAENGCGQSEPIAGYIYGELSATENLELERHLSQCAACTQEVAEFGMVHQTMVDWRKQSLAFLAQPLTAFTAEMDQSRTRLPATRKRSAIAALREFFALSPLWLQAATAMAALLFLSLAAVVVVKSLRDVDTESLVAIVPVVPVADTPIPDSTITPGPTAVVKARSDSVSTLPVKLLTPKRPTDRHVQIAVRRPLIVTKLSSEEVALVATTVRSQSAQDTNSLPSLSDLLDETDGAARQMQR